MGSGVSFGSRRARKQPRLEGHEGSVNAVSLTSDGGLVVTGSDDCTARVWDAETRELVAEMKGHTQYVTCLTITANDEFVVTGRYLTTIGFRMKPPRAVNDTMSDVCVCTAAVLQALQTRPFASGTYSQDLAKLSTKATKQLSTAFWCTNYRFSLPPTTKLHATGTSRQASACRCTWAT